jgi:hypothetical protein
MLFLFSPKGMGIAPIIKLSVVSRAYVLLLFLPRFPGFGTNESQIAYHLHYRLAILVHEASEAHGPLFSKGEKTAKGMMRQSDVYVLPGREKMGNLTQELSATSPYTSRRMYELLMIKA